MPKILYLLDSLSKKKKNIILDKEKIINLYVCGITPYDHCHIGHARCYISYDILVRLLRYDNYKITYVQNITDVNDKIFAKAHDKYGDASRYTEIAQSYHTQFQSLLQQLGCLTPDSLPKVSESIEDIIELIERIMHAGYAYETTDGIYFNTLKYEKYGELSQRKLIDEQNKSRIEHTHEKNTQYDFALWKKTNNTPSWPSPWGNGVPGWHIECSAMIEKTFNGKSLTIHGGGMDLLFPHHENEKAQTECCLNKKITEIWMHVAFIMINKEKMSKSLGNCFYLKDIVTEYDPMAFRLYILMHHYTSPIDFDIDGLKSAANAYNNLLDIFKDPFINSEVEAYTHNILDEINTLLYDNLNTAAVIGLIFKHKDIIKNNNLLQNKLKNIIVYILGLSLEKKNIVINNSEEIQTLLAERLEARKNKNFQKADELKKKLISLGAIIIDEKI